MSAQLQAVAIVSMSTKSSPVTVSAVRRQRLRKTPGGVLVGGRVKSGETLGNGCSSTKSLLSSWKRGTYRGTWMNESIQILSSFYTRLLKLSAQMHSQSQSKVKGRLTNFYR